MIEIVGAGMAGLLAANVLHRYNPIVTEMQSNVPNNHSAVLRFRTPVVGDTLNIPFKKVSMIKSALPWKNPVADALGYSLKNTGKYRSDRSVIEGLVAEDRWIAPSDLIQQMAERAHIQFGKQFTLTSSERNVISTMPMPTLMAITNYPNRLGISFVSHEGLNIRAQVRNCDAYVSMLVPNPELPMSRISITGNELIVEVPRYICTGQFDDLAALNNVECACNILGLDYNDDITNVTWSHQKYAKIAPIDDDIRKDFIHWATDKFGIFSLGRFATWRPRLLLDDLINDIRLIDRWIGKRDMYSVARHR